MWQEVRAVIAPPPPATLLPRARARCRHSVCWLLMLLQWQHYERKVAERGAEQQLGHHSVLPKTAGGLLDSVRRQLGSSPGGGGGGGDTLIPAVPAGVQSAVTGVPPYTPWAAGLATPAEGLQPQTLSAVSVAGLQQMETPSYGAAASSLKENWAPAGGGEQLFRCSVPLKTAPFSTLPSPGIFAAAPGASAAAGGGGDSTLHQASTQFLQQVEDMRRKYMAEVERLKVGSVGWGEVGLIRCQY